MSYSFRDDNPQPINYYRIRPVMANGSERYSSVQLVRFGGDRKLSLAAWPNPVKDNYTISCSNFPEGTYELRLYDMKGGLMQVKRVQVTDGIYAIPMKR